MISWGMQVPAAMKVGHHTFTKVTKDVLFGETASAATDGTGAGEVVKPEVVAFFFAEGVELRAAAADIAAARAISL